jgi:hypothetical protein
LLFKQIWFAAAYAVGVYKQGKTSKFLKGGNKVILTIDISS